jgi:hypothetical protein
MYLVWGGGPLDIVLSGSGRLVHGPLDGRCKARNLNTLIPLVPVLRFRACPSVWSVLHTVGQRSLHLFTNYDGSPGPLSSSLFFSLVGSGPPQRGRSRLNISTMGGNFACIRSPILVHPRWSCWVNCDLVRSCWVSNCRFVTVLTYGLTGHTLAKYPTKRLPRARSIEGMAIGMGASWHRKMSRPNELVGTRNVRKSERKE